MMSFLAAVLPELVEGQLTAMDRGYPSLVLLTRVTRWRAQALFSLRQNGTFSFFSWRMFALRANIRHEIRMKYLAAAGQKLSLAPTA